MKVTVSDKVKKSVGAGAFFLLMLLPFVVQHQDLYARPTYLIGYTQQKGEQVEVSRFVCYTNARKSPTDKSPWCQRDNIIKGELTWD